MNIIADVAGRFDELCLLLVQMPKDEKIILVGDIVDRGPKSADVVSLAMNNPNIITLKGNHEDMMIDAFRKTDRYSPGTWEFNGGTATLTSYMSSDYGAIPESHIAWMEKLPIFYQEEGLFVSHAPWSLFKKLGEYDKESDALWNRYPPKIVEGVVQIFGHNSQLWKYGNHAICIDDCCSKRLTGIHWPSKKLYFQDYL